jgi:amidase
VTEETVPALDDDRLGEALATMWGPVIAREVERWGETLGRPIGIDELEPLNRTLVGMAEGMGGTAYLRGLDRMQAWSRGLAAWFADFDVLMVPTVPEPAIRLGRINAAAPDPFAQLLDSGTLITFTLPFNATGMPAMSLPLGTTTDGLPVGVQIVAPFGREDVLFRLGSQLEMAAPWADRRPRVAAA